MTVKQNEENRGVIPLFAEPDESEWLLCTLELNAFKKNVKLLLRKPKEWQFKIGKFTLEATCTVESIRDSVELSNCCWMVKARE